MYVAVSGLDLRGGRHPGEQGCGGVRFEAPGPLLAGFGLEQADPDRVRPTLTTQTVAAATLDRPQAPQN